MCVYVCACVCTSVYGCIRQSKYVCVFMYEKLLLCVCMKVCVCVCVCVNIYIYIYIYSLVKRVKCSPMVWGPRVHSQAVSYQRLQKWYLIPPCLTLSNIRYVSRVKWSNPGKGVAPSPIPRCSSYWKESLLVAFDYDRQLYMCQSECYCVYMYVKLLLRVCESVCVCLWMCVNIYIYIEREIDR